VLSTPESGPWAVHGLALSPPKGRSPLPLLASRPYPQGSPLPRNGLDFGHETSVKRIFHRRTLVKFGVLGNVPPALSELMCFSSWLPDGPRPILPMTVAIHCAAHHRWVIQDRTKAIRRTTSIRRAGIKDTWELRHGMVNPHPLSTAPRNRTIDPPDNHPTPQATYRHRRFRISEEFHPIPRVPPHRRPPTSRVTSSRGRRKGFRRSVLPLLLNTPAAQNERVSSGGSSLWSWLGSIQGCPIAVGFLVISDETLRPRTVRPPQQRFQVMEAFSSSRSEEYLDRSPLPRLSAGAVQDSTERAAAQVQRFL